MLDEQRVMQLIGDGGGGLPLPLAFSTVVEEILDHDYASFGRLENVLSDALKFKEDRVLASPFKTWTGFTEAITGQLEAISVIQKLNGAYFLGDAFQPGTRITAIPGTGVWFQVWAREDRARRERDERMLMDVRVILAEHKRLDRYTIEDLTDAGQAALKVFRDNERIGAAAERSLSAGRETGSLSLPPQGQRLRTLKSGDLPPRPSAREVAAEYGLGGGQPRGRITNPFGVDGKRECNQCHHRRLPEDFDVYTDGKGKRWYLRGVCRGCWSDLRNPIRRDNYNKNKNK
jgi:hypothetical protein